MFSKGFFFRGVKAVSEHGKGINIGREEGILNTGNQYFLLFPQCFSLFFNNSNLLIAKTV